jgi:SAM-dependent methyltransferase
MKEYPYNKRIKKLIKNAEKGQTRINLGCGTHYKKGYINCDISPNIKKDKYVDLEKHLPFKDNYADTIIIISVIEHINNAVGLLKEVHRVLKPEGILIITMPHFTNCYQFADLTQKHFASYQTFKLICSNHFYAGMGFKEEKIKLLFSKGRMFWDYIIEPIANMFPMLYEYTPLRMFQCWEVYAELTKRSKVIQ